YMQIGTEGIGLGAGTGLSDNFGVRAEANYGRLNGDFNAGDLDYEAKMKLRGAGIYGDWFPTPSTFRLTTGASFNNSRIDGTTASSSTLTINGRQYSAAGEAVIATIEWPTVMPYPGIGVGRGPRARGWGFFADLGVLIGKPKTTLTATPGLAQVPAADLERERRELQDKADDYRIHPVVKIGVSYAF
ncbi:MAG: hypothetical protein ABWZ78_10770, partial [Burkholderiaceae bacterium]